MTVASVITSYLLGDNMKKLFIVALVLLTLALGCSKGKSSSDSEAPAAKPEAAAPDSAKPDVAEDGTFKLPGTPARALTSFKDNKVHFEVKSGGPAFDITVSEEGNKVELLRTDVTGKDAISMEGVFDVSNSDAGEDANSGIWIDDFNFDGFTDIALLTELADLERYQFLIWNDGAQKFDTVDVSSAIVPTLDRDNKYLILSPIGFFTPESPEACPSRYTFEGSKLVRKPWVLPKEKDGVVRVTSDPNPKFPLIGSMVFEFRNEKGGVREYVVSCGEEQLSGIIDDAVVEGMEKKDVNGDGIVDLLFKSKTDPSKRIDVSWNMEYNVYESFDISEDGAEE